MKYITQVQINPQQIKHIIEVSGKNIEVVEQRIQSHYKYSYFYKGLIIAKDNFSVAMSSPDTSVHLAEVVLAIELARLIKGYTEENNYEN